MLLRRIHCGVHLADATAAELTLRDVLQRIREDVARDELRRKWCRGGGARGVGERVCPLALHDAVIHSAK